MIVGVYKILDLKRCCRMPFLSFLLNVYLFRIWFGSRNEDPSDGWRPILNDQHSLHKSQCAISASDKHTISGKVLEPLILNLTR